jgi:hypothetical protein
MQFSYRCLRQSICTSGFAATALMVFVFQSARADDAPWVDLFNGKDLTGWQIVGEKGPPCWAVEEECLFPSKAGGWLSTDRHYANFELELEFNLGADANSGVFLRAPHEGRSSRLGMEIQLIDEFGEKYKNLESWQKTAALYHVQPARAGSAKKAGQWQKLRIRAAGREVTVVLNGREVLKANLDEYPDKEAEHPGLKRAKGYIGLQNYGGRDARFRHIRLRELP